MDALVADFNKTHPGIVVKSDTGGTTADHMLEKVQASLAPPNVSVWRELDALVISLEDDCRRLHARYMRARDPLVALVARLAGVQRARSAAVRSPETRVAG